METIFEGVRLRTESECDDGVMDGRRARKAVFRRTIDYNSSVTVQMEKRLRRGKYSRRGEMQPDVLYHHLITPPQDYKDNPMNCVCAKHVRTSTNKNKCPIYTVCWTPDGRRLITAASSGEFTLWNGLTFNFETILQAHETHIKAMKWSHNEDWLLSGDDYGMVKYWQANMNDVNVFQAHKDAVRGVSFCPSDKKFVTCSVDNTVRIWDFQTAKEERVLRGHGGEVKCVSWHPTKSIVLSGSKDSQQPMKLWDPKTGECISTMYIHKNSCNDISINKNGNWFLTASKDHTIKLFDLRNLKTEMQVFRGHIKDVIQVAWHPFHENLFASGSGDGVLMYWLAGTDMEVGSVEDAHDNIIWSLDWHPMGHILASGSNDFTTKFWTRNRPGDVLKDNQQTDHSFEVAKPSDSGNTAIEIDTIIEQRVKRNNSLEELDLQKLSSSIEADLDKSDILISDIPGLSEGMKNDLDIIVGEDEVEGKEGKLKGSINRIINKQFASNWSIKKTFPITCLMETEPSFIPLPAIPPTPQIQQLPIYHNPQFNPPAPFPPRPFMEDPRMNCPPIQNDYCPPMQNDYRPPIQNDYRPSMQNDYCPTIQNDYRPSMQNDYRPPLQNDYRPRSIMPPPRNQFQNFPNQPPRFRPPQFFDNRPDEFQMHEMERNEQQFNAEQNILQQIQKNRHQRPFQHFNSNPRNCAPQDNNFYNQNNFMDNRLPFNGNPQHRFAPFGNQRLPFRNKPEDQFDFEYQNQRSFQRDFQPNYSDNSFESPFQRFPSREFAQKNSENPFEPQKSTGSSKTFIPLSMRNTEPSNRRFKRHGNRRTGRNW